MSKITLELELDKDTMESVLALLAGLKKERPVSHQEYLRDKANAEVPPEVKDLKFTGDYSAAAAALTEIVRDAEVDKVINEEFKKPSTSQDMLTEEQVKQAIETQRGNGSIILPASDPEDKGPEIDIQLPGTVEPEAITMPPPVVTEEPVNLPTDGPLELDSAGMPWDKRIHSEVKGKMKNKTWKYKKLIKDKLDAQGNNLVEAVEAENKAKLANQIVNVPLPTEEGIEMPKRTMEVPKTLPVIDTVITWLELMKLVTDNKIPEQVYQAVAKELNVETFIHLNLRSKDDPTILQKAYALLKEKASLC